MFKVITKNIWILSFISLFTDIASEMLYPIMPIYLKNIGFSILTIGILEGVAEASAGISKGYFGKLSDATGKRVPFVRAGYMISSIAKPLVALWTSTTWIFLMRTSDRFAKGIRTGARDAILSEESLPKTKGTVFGFHRAMDTIGAAIGPLIALIYLYFYPNSYINVFYIAFIPGILSILFSLFLKQTERKLTHKKGNVRLFSFLYHWKSSPKTYKRLVTGLLIFALFNSSDVFLLLKIKEVGLNDTQVIGIYIFYNLVYALFAMPIGMLADKIGLKKILQSGIVFFALVYFGFSLSNNISIFIVLFFIYGLYAAATEGVSKAWISNISNKDDLATAIGTFSAFQSIATMISSTLAGIIWVYLGSSYMFTFSAIGALLVVIYLHSINYKQSSNDK